MALWVARHATPCGVDGLCYGALDVPAITVDTERAARALADVVPPDWPVFSSPRRRCLQLAEALQVLRPDLPYQVDERLAEMDFGLWEGVPWNEIPKDDIDRWTHDFAAHRFGGNESVDSVMLRVGAAWDAARANYRRSGVGTLWISHAGVARAVHLLAQGRRAVHRALDWPREAPGLGDYGVYGLD